MRGQPSGVQIERHWEKERRRRRESKQAGPQWLSARQILLGLWSSAHFSLCGFLFSGKQLWCWAAMRFQSFKKRGTLKKIRHEKEVNSRQKMVKAKIGKHFCLLSLYYFSVLFCSDHVVNLLLLYFSWDAIWGHLFQAAWLMTLS